MTTDATIDRARRLDEIEADLAGVERALGRLDAGHYFTCIACAAPLTDDWLTMHPVTERCEACAAA